MQCAASARPKARRRREPRRLGCRRRPPRRTRPRRNTVASYSPRFRAPDDLVHLQLQPGRALRGEQPAREILRSDFAEARREQDRNAAPQTETVDDLDGPAEVGLAAYDHLQLVALAQRLKLAEDAMLLARSRGVQVHDLLHPAGAGVQRALAMRLERCHVG